MITSDVDAVHQLVIEQLNARIKELEAESVVYHATVARLEAKLKEITA